MSNDRVVVLVDMDCFYCQVEEKLRPEIKGKPIAVVQYNQWKGGGIIAVNYLARAKGVTRSMRGDEAKEKCPDIELPQVPCVRGKADISKYRNAGKEVAHVLQSFTPLLERASIDEAYLDITELVKQKKSKYKHYDKKMVELLPNTFALGYDNLSDFIEKIYNSYESHNLDGFDNEKALNMFVGAIITSEIRSAVFNKTGFQCSAGIAHNKILAKLVCGMNKPNKQTVLPYSSIFQLFESMPITKIKSLGGKFGNTVCDILKVSKMNDLLKYTEKELQKHFDDKNGSFLYNIARGIDREPVTPRFTSKSIGCCKKFAGKNAIVDLNTLKHWLSELGDEIEERITLDSEENNRYATQMVISFTKQFNNGKEISCSRSLNINCQTINGSNISENALDLLKKDSKQFFTTDETAEAESNMQLKNPIKFLGISVGKFEDYETKNKNIKFFFGRTNPNTQIQSNKDEPGTSKNQNNDESSNSVDKKKSFFTSYLKNIDKTPKVINENESSSEEKSKIEHLNDSADSCNSIDGEINESLKGEQIHENHNPRNLSHNIFHRDEEIKTECQQCHRMISIENLLEHQDFHFAESLNFNKNEKDESAPSKNDSNKRDISTFFKINVSKEQTEKSKCEECGHDIPIPDMAEHLDFHAAKRLHRELNKTNSKIAEKRKSESSTKQVPKKGKCNIKPINAFFQKSA